MSDLSIARIDWRNNAEKANSWICVADYDTSIGVSDSEAFWQLRKIASNKQDRKMQMDAL